MQAQDRYLTTRERNWFALNLAVLGMLMVACSSCATIQRTGEPPTTSDPAVVTLVKVGDNGEEAGFCTAWKLDDERMMSAGHCCDEGASYVTRGPHAVLGGTAEVLYDDDKHDVCVLKGKIKGAHISLAEREPQLGEPVWTAGYPKTEFLISAGYWSGRDDDNQCKASVAVWGGASGSPIMNNRGEAVGVLIAYRPPMSNLAYCAPLEWLKVAKNLGH